MKFDRPGLVAMAPMREGTGTTLAKNSGSSQFFITLREMKFPYFLKIYLSHLAKHKKFI